MATKQIVLRSGSRADKARVKAVLQEHLRDVIDGEVLLGNIAKCDEQLGKIVDKMASVRNSPVAKDEVAILGARAIVIEKRAMLNLRLLSKKLPDLRPNDMLGSGETLIEEIRRVVVRA